MLAAVGAAGLCFSAECKRARLAIYKEIRQREWLGDDFGTDRRDWDGTANLERCIASLNENFKNEHGQPLDKSGQQEEMTDLMVQCLAKDIVGERTWVRSRQEICKRYGWDPDYDMSLLLMTTPRQFGKTTTQIDSMTKFSVFIPGLQAAVASNSLKNSIKLIKAITSRLRQFVPKQNFVTVNQKLLEFIPPFHSDESEGRLTKLEVVVTKDSVIENQRGTAFDILFVDEAEFFGVKAWWNIFLPILPKDRGRMIAWTTRKGHKSIFDVMASEKDDLGNPMLKHREFSMVCEACRAANRTAECDHMQAALPVHMNRRKVLMIKRMMASMRLDMMNRELLNVPAQIDTFCFSPVSIKAMTDAKPFIVSSTAHPQTLRARRLTPPPRRSPGSQSAATSS